MGFGKWVLGGVCAVGAVVAAPVVLPAAGLAIAAAPVTGAIGVSAGLGLAAASTGTVAATAAAAGAVGVAAGAMQEKKWEEAYNKGKKDGNITASKVYEEKMRNQEQDFKAKIKEYIDNINDLKEKLAEYKEKETLTEEEQKEKDRLIAEMLEYIKKLEEEIGGKDNSMTPFVSECISDARNLILAF